MSENSQEPKSGADQDRKDRAFKNWMNGLFDGFNEAIKREQQDADPDIQCLDEMHVWEYDSRPSIHAQAMGNDVFGLYRKERCQRCGKTRNIVSTEHGWEVFQRNHWFTPTDFIPMNRRKGPKPVRSQYDPPINPIGQEPGATATNSDNSATVPVLTNIVHFTFKKEIAVAYEVLMNEQGKDLSTRVVQHEPINSSPDDPDVDKLLRIQNEQAIKALRSGTFLLKLE